MAVSSRERRRLSKSSTNGGRKSSSQSSERRKCSNQRNNHDDCSRRPSSVPPPSSPPAQHNGDDDEEEQEEEHDHVHLGLKRRTGSDLSVSSLPSHATSPVEVFIARGALTDESGTESDLQTGSQYSYAHLGTDRVSGGFRSLVSCLVPGIKSGKNQRRRRHDRDDHTLIQQDAEDLRRSEEKNGSCPIHPPPPSVCSSESRSRSRRSYRLRGLSTTPELDPPSPCSHSKERSESRFNQGDDPVPPDVMNGPRSNIDNDNVFVYESNEGIGINTSSGEKTRRRRKETLESSSSEGKKEIAPRTGHLAVNQVMNVDLFIPTQMVTPPSPLPLDQCKSSFSSSFLPPSPLQDECPGSSGSK